MEIYSSIILILSFLTLFSCCLTVLSRNLLFSIFSLVLFFVSSLWFLVFYNAEYIMVVFLILYLGAIVVFFLFVIMLLDKEFLVISVKFTINRIFNSFIFLVFVSLFFSMIARAVSFPKNGMIFIVDLNNDLVFTNIERIGFLLYTEFGILLILGACILLIAIIGCVLILKIK